MILTGKEIERQVLAGRVVIDPFDPRHLEPNSYGFHLGDSIIRYRDRVIDSRKRPEVEETLIDDCGYQLQPGHLYLGSTMETIGSNYFAKTLFANRSIGAMGVWIQLSAPLGHTGAILPWTLELTVVHPVIIYPGMLMGKIAFWRSQGAIFGYRGKYSASRGAVPSRLSWESNEW